MQLSLQQSIGLIMTNLTVIYYNVYIIWMLESRQTMQFSPIWEQQSSYVKSILYLHFLFSRPNHQQKHLLHEEQTLSVNKHPLHEEQTPSVNKHPMNHRVSADNTPLHISRVDMESAFILKALHYYTLVKRLNETIKKFWLTSPLLLQKKINYFLLC